MKQSYVLISLMAFLSFSLGAFAQPQAVPKGQADVFQLQGKSLRKIGTANSSQSFSIVGQTKNRQWIVVNWEGVRGYMRTNDIQIQRGGRGVASTSSTSVYSGMPADKKVFLAGGPAFQTNSFGIGLGLNGTYVLPVQVTHNPLEVGVHLQYFPSLGSSSVDDGLGGTIDASGNAFIFSALASTMLYGSVRKGFGPEAGFMMVRTSVSLSDATLGDFSASTSTLGFTLGGIGRYPISEDITFVGGLRFLIFSSTAVQLHGGVAFAL